MICLRSHMICLSSYPAPDLVLRKPIFLTAVYFGGVLFSQTPVFVCEALVVPSTSTRPPPQAPRGHDAGAARAAGLTSSGKLAACSTVAAIRSVDSLCGPLLLRLIAKKEGLTSSGKHGLGSETR